MVWAGGLVVALVGGACVERPAPEECRRDARADERDPGPAYTGFQWACREGPRCPERLDCDDPDWRQVADPVLARATACLLGPCERRRECVDEAFATCDALAQ
ncbi:MAG: hypothetical protein IPL61_36535 [Myxococcales bacterium]|nr:hypothetical protein [Myxococcales bacterium]